MPRLYTTYTKDDDGKEVWKHIDVEQINYYLVPGENILVKSRSSPLCPVPKIIKGSQPTDGGNLLLSEVEKNFFVKKYPDAEKYVRQFLGAEEFIHNKKRFCLWLVDCPPNEIKNNKFIYERVKAVKEFRLKSKKIPTQKAAEIPHLFTEIRQPTSEYILIPRVSSERRNYIPIDFVSEKIICGDANLMIPDAEIWHFGILTSSVHMAWMRLVAGRLKSDYRYSAKIVYNNFVWVKMEFIQYAELILATKNILDCRKKYPDASLADLYDEVTMPKDLSDAHKKLDEIVLDIYGFSKKMTDEEIALEMLDNYKNVCEQLNL